jgi:hypothetical protein
VRGRLGKDKCITTFITNTTSQRHRRNLSAPHDQHISPIAAAPPELSGFGAWFAPLLSFAEVEQGAKLLRRLRANPFDLADRR